MKQLLKFAVGVCLLIGLNQQALANIVSMPKNLLLSKQHIAFRSSTLAPLAFVKFCMNYPTECRQPRVAFRGGAVKLNDQRYADLVDVNRNVNVAIRPQPNLRGVAYEEWLINPASGDCNDYAVSKKHELRARGWPDRALFLSEVVVASGEHHLVLVVRTDRGDLVLDNMTGAIRPVAQVRYQWIRAQKPGAPMAWHDLASRVASI
jgi:predicted transglutaminase-like cysteine proteinase